MAETELRSKRVFIVEDDALIATLFEEYLGDLGCEVVGVAHSLAKALDMIGPLDFDAAILDVNLNGQWAFPVADKLLAKRIPFLFATGYGDAAIPNSLHHVPTLAKPFQLAALESGLRAALGISIENHHP